MPARDRALFATSALLYLGPLYAGLAGHGYETMPVFALVFMLWLNVVRPGDWPQTAAAWRTPRALAWPVLLIAGQMAVVVFCLSIGRGIGGLLAQKPPVPLLFTLLVSMLAIALARLLKRRGDGAPAQVAVEGLQIGAGILDVMAPGLPGQRDEAALAAAVVAAIADLPPGGAAPAELDPILDFVERDGLAQPVLAALGQAPEAHLPNLQAQARLALRPGVAPGLLGTGQIGRAVARAFASRTPALMQETAGALNALLPVLPGLAGELPGALRLQSTAAEMEQRDAMAARAMRTLAQRLNGEAKVA